MHIMNECNDDIVEMVGKITKWKDYAVHAQNFQNQISSLIKLHFLNITFPIGTTIKASNTSPSKINEHIMIKLVAKYNLPLL